MRILFTVLLLFTMSFARAGEESEPKTKRILVVMFDRFNLHSEVELSDINRINKISGDEFYPLLITAMSEAFEINSSDRVEFKILDAEDLRALHAQVRYGMRPGDSHYYCFLDSLENDLVREYLDDYECDYILTVNWYRILQTKTTVKGKEKRKVSFYTDHFIDYDLFTRESKRILMGSSIKIQVPPSQSNVSKQGLLIKDMKVELNKVAENIASELQ